METRTVYLDDSYAHFAQAGGEGQAIIILHGWAASLKQWEWFLPVLADAGFKAYAIDLLGHGQAPRLPHQHTTQDYLDHVCQWMAAVDIQRPIFLGHSMGGYLSLRYILDHPGATRGLILVDPLYDYHQFGRYHQLARRMMRGPRVLTEVGQSLLRRAPAWLIEASHAWYPNDVGGAPPAMRRQIALDYKRADPQIVQTISTIRDLRPHLAQLALPTLVTWGCRDHLLSPASFDALVELLPGAQAHCFAEVGHHPHLVRTESFTELVLSFLGQQQDEG